MENVVTNSQVYEYSIMRRVLIFFLFLSLSHRTIASAQDGTLPRKAREIYDKAQASLAGKAIPRSRHPL
jgi:hypothetical protein